MVPAIVARLQVHLLIQSHESVTIRTLFPTYVYHKPLESRAGGDLRRRLLEECRLLSLDDEAGQRWSRKNYPGGYTSYGTAHRLHLMSPTFEALQRKLQRHVAAFSRAVSWDLRDKTLSMTDCWVNVMPKSTVHGLHLHPLSTLSGTYYVKVPKGAPGIKFEDPRLDRLMAAPPRLQVADGSTSPWITLPATAGDIVLFESWLRHEVVPNPVDAERISISFNYNWF